MPIRYSFKSGSKILVAKAEGDISPEENAQSNARVKRELERRPDLKLLVDMCAANVSAEPVVFNAMMRAFYDLVGDALPVAVVDDAVSDPAHAMLAETNAYIAGAQMRIFNDHDAAYAWLERL